jgi:hypothetical protein
MIFLLSFVGQENFIFVTSPFQVAFQKQGLNLAYLTYLKDGKSCQKYAEGWMRHARNRDS